MIGSRNKNLFWFYCDLTKTLPKLNNKKTQKQKQDKTNKKQQLKTQQIHISLQLYNICSNVCWELLSRSTSRVPAMLTMLPKVFLSASVLNSQTGQFWLKSTVLQAGLSRVTARLSRQIKDTVKLSCLAMPLRGDYFYSHRAVKVSTLLLILLPMIYALSVTSWWTLCLSLSIDGWRWSGWYCYPAQHQWDWRVLCQVAFTYNDRADCFSVKFLFYPDHHTKKRFLTVQ